MDDSIAEKPYTDENDIICWHYDHSQQRTVKGINFVTCLYHNQGVSLPVGFELVRKTHRYTDPKDGKEKRRANKTKNEMYRDLLQQAVKNQIPFKYVLNDIWFAAAENMKFVKNTLKKEFVMPLKGNRKVAMSVDAKQQGRYVADVILGRAVQIELDRIAVEKITQLHSMTPGYRPAADEGQATYGWGVEVVKMACDCSAARQSVNFRSCGRKSRRACRPDGSCCTSRPRRA